jgi:hypothetical protein
VNPYLSRVVLRPRSPFEVFDLTLRFFRERARPLAVMTAWTVLPSMVACAGLTVLSGGAWWTLLVPLAIGPVLQAPFTVLGGRLLFAEDASVGQVLRATLKGMGGALAAIAVGGLAMGLLCTGFGVLVLPALAFLPETALLERVPLGRGLRRSLSLAGGQVMVAVAAVAGRWVLTGWGALLGELTGQSVVGFVLQLGEPFGSLLAGHATPWMAVGILLVQPLIAVFRLLLYVDVRTRMEGWDLQVGLRALGLGAAP